jgi:hypothetical protein
MNIFPSPVTFSLPFYLKGGFMRFLCSIAYVLVLGMAVYAADTTSAAAQTPAPAPKPAVAPAGPTLTWSGLAMIRLREDIIKNNYAAGTEIAVGSRNYSNRLAYKLGAKIQTSSQVSLMFELGNEWYATELVSGGDPMTLPSGSQRHILNLLFLQAWAQWDPGYLPSVEIYHYPDVWCLGLFGVQHL